MKLNSVLNGPHIYSAHIRVENRHFNSVGLIVDYSS